MKQKISVLCILLVSSIHLQAQTSQPAERPTLTKGDTWTYRVLDGLTSNELRQFSIEFAEIEADKLLFRSTNKSTNQITTLMSDLNLNSCYTLRNSSDLVCKGSFEFPMSVGQKTSYVNLPWPNGIGHGSATCDVKSFEKVTVPAGTFDAFRLECGGAWTRIFEGSNTGTQKTTVWYAPSLKRSVKVIYESRWSGGLDKNTTELVSYKVQ